METISTEHYQLELPYKPSSVSVYWKKITIPKGIPALLETFVRETIRENPDDIYKFLTDFTESLLAKRAAEEQEGAESSSATASASADKAAVVADEESPLLDCQAPIPTSYHVAEEATEPKAAVALQSQPASPSPQLKKEDEEPTSTDLPSPSSSQVQQDEDADALAEEMLAASKIQAGYRGFKTRKALKEQKLGASSAPQEAEDTSAPEQTEPSNSTIPENEVVIPVEEPVIEAKTTTATENETTPTDDTQISISPQSPPPPANDDEEIAAEIKTPLETIREESFDHSSSHGVPPRKGSSDSLKPVLEQELVQKAVEDMVLREENEDEIITSPITSPAPDDGEEVEIEKKSAPPQERVYSVQMMSTEDISTALGGLLDTSESGEDPSLHVDKPLISSTSAANGNDIIEETIIHHKNDEMAHGASSLGDLDNADDACNDKYENSAALQNGDQPTESAQAQQICASENENEQNALESIPNAEDGVEDKMEERQDVINLSSSLENAGDQTAVCGNEDDSVDVDDGDKNKKSDDAAEDVVDVDKEVRDDHATTSSDVVQNIGNEEGNAEKNFTTTPTAPHISDQQPEIGQLADNANETVGDEEEESNQRSHSVLTDTSVDREDTDIGTPTDFSAHEEIIISPENNRKDESPSNLEELQKLSENLEEEIEKEIMEQQEVKPPTEGTTPEVPKTEEVAPPATTEQKGDSTSASTDASSSEAGVLQVEIKPSEAAPAEEVKPEEGKASPEAPAEPQTGASEEAKLAEAPKEVEVKPAETTSPPPAEEKQVEQSSPAPTPPADAASPQESATSPPPPSAETPQPTEAQQEPAETPATVEKVSETAAPAADSPQSPEPPVPILRPESEAPTDATSPPPDKPADASPTPESVKSPEPEAQPAESPKSPEPSDKPAETPTSPEPQAQSTETPKSPEPDPTPTESPKSPEPSDKPAETPKSPEPSDKPAETPKSPEPSDMSAETPKSPEPSDKPAETPKNPEQSDKPAETPLSPEPSSQPSEVPITSPEPQASPTESPKSPELAPQTPETPKSQEASSDKPAETPTSPEPQAASTESPKSPDPAAVTPETPTSPEPASPAPAAEPTQPTESPAPQPSESQESKTETPVSPPPAETPKSPEPVPAVATPAVSQEKSEESVATSETTSQDTVLTSPPPSSDPATPAPPTNETPASEISKREKDAKKKRSGIIDELPASFEEASKKQEKPTVKPRLGSGNRQASLTTSSPAADATITTPLLVKEEESVNSSQRATAAEAESPSVVRRNKPGSGRNSRRSRVATSKYRSGLVIESEVSMDEMEKEIEREMMDTAATKIQANFRGFKTRKTLSQIGVSKKGKGDKDKCCEGDKATQPPATAPTALSDSEITASNQQQPQCWEEIMSASSALIASRGGNKPPPLSCLRSRSYPGSHEDDPYHHPIIGSVDEDEEDHMFNPEPDIDLELDPDYMNRAATKIQANFRGYQVRKSFKRSGNKENDNGDSNKSQKLSEDAEAEERAKVMETHERLQERHDNDNNNVWLDIDTPAEPEKAAAKIQASFRSYKQRQIFHQKKKAAITIQANIRGFLTRKRLANMRRRSFQRRRSSAKAFQKELEQMRKVNEAATKIQAVFRGYQVRSKLPRSSSMINEHEQLIDE